MDDKIYDAFASGRNVLLHGPAGTGKTYQINKLISLINQEYPRDAYFVGAPTGLAAIHINGSTIHSLFGIRPQGKLSDSVIRDIVGYDYIAAEESKVHEVIKDIVRGSRFSDTAVKFLIIDEISMTGAVLLTAIDAILREKFIKDQPMGGIQCIFSGDFFQLPPVNDEFCCFTNVWNQLDIVQIDLTQSQRYGDNQEYYEFICRLRKAQLNTDDRAFLASRRKAYIDCEHRKLPIEPLTLFPKNANIDRYNENKLEAIKEPKYVFKSKDASRIYNTMDRSQFKTCEANINTMLDTLLVHELSLKVGANVIFVVNYDVSKKLANGRMGKIIAIRRVDGEPDFVDDTIVIDNIDDYIVVVKDMDEVIHEIRPFTSSNHTRKFTCSRHQFPFRLAWAISIHRSQGMSLDAAIIDIGSSFCDGQSYVALSRVREGKGIFLSDVNLTKIKASRKILAQFGCESINP